jgi:exopolysaccharide biosynthesis polyprenyl glycosylphosphotransferase
VDTRIRRIPESGELAHEASRSTGSLQQRARAPFGRALAAVPAAIQEPREARVGVESRDRLYRRMLAYADVASACLALLVCVSVIGDGRLRLMSFLALPLVVAVSKIHGLYERDELMVRKTTMDEAPQLFQQATLYTLIVWLLEDVLVAGDLGRSQVVALWVTLFVTALVGRRLARSLARKAAPPERCMLIGDASSYATLVARMSLQRIARFGARSASDQELRELIEWANVDRVIIEPQSLPPEEMLDFVRAAKSVGVRVSLLPRVLDVVGSSVVFDDLHGMTLLGVRRFGLSRSSTLVKRAFDVTGAVVALVLVAPLMAAIAIAVRLGSRGPILFRQTRVGREGRPFEIYKFRTMVVDAEERKAELLPEADGDLFKLPDDPRVTRVGRLLRKTSLDELPQLFNVLRGNMSLVGPRPLIADEDRQITGLDRRRLQLTPGMTGPWQIMGARVPLSEMVKLDYLYLAGWSLWLDLKIMLRTVPYMIARRGM